MMHPMRMIFPETWGTAGTTLVTFIFLWDMFRRYCPPELQRYLEKWTQSLSRFLNPEIQICINEYIGAYLRSHEAYSLVEAYLSVNSSNDTKRLKAEMKTANDDKLLLTMDENETTTDEFNGVKVKWIAIKIARKESKGFSYYPEPDKRYYKLKFHKKHKKMITETYLEHVIKNGKEIKARNRQRMLYSNGHDRSYWSGIVFEHPATFDSLAMEPEKKGEIIEDLLTFSKSKDFYATIGKAWKRGYLLYGPPGTGKSTMIAAMANLLDYDVYDLELTSVKDNTELRRLLTETTSKSIIVIEDIDCSLQLTGKREDEKKESEEDTGETKKGSSSKKKETSNKVTLSGLLNFIDGLWSACTGERLIVFTTNHVDKIDPALKRRGRMDKHIELSYCKYEGFKVLAKNYLAIEENPLFQKVKELMDDVEITPADVAENLMPKSAKESPEERLLHLIQALELAKEKQIMKRQEEKETTIHTVEETEGEETKNCKGGANDKETDKNAVSPQEEKLET